MLYLGYIAPLTALEFLASKARLAYEIDKNPGIEPFMYPYWHLTPAGMLSNYVWGLIEIYILAYLVNVTAPLFSGERNVLHAIKVIAFSLTPLWIGKLFIAVPVFSLDRSIPLLCTIYFVYLLYMALTLLMKTSVPRNLLYTLGILMLYLGLTYRGRKTTSMLADFYRQWPVLDPRTKTTILVLIIVSALGGAVFWAYRRTFSSAR